MTAEFTYKNGYPAVGLKEYTNLGKERTQPTIQILKQNIGNGTYELKLSLSGKNVKRIKKVKFYMGNLIEDKYFKTNLESAKVTSEKTGTLTVTSNQVEADKTVNVVANAITADGLKLILQKKVKL